MRKIIRILSALFFVFALSVLVACTSTAPKSPQGDTKTQERSVAGAQAKKIPHREPEEEEKERDGIVIPVPPVSLPIYLEV